MKKQFFFGLKAILYLCLIFFSSCIKDHPITQPDIPLAATAGKKQAQQDTLSADGRETYQIKQGDVLIIKIYPGEEFKQPLEVEVNSDGDINIPLLNQVHVSGLTTVGAESKIARLLDEKYIVNPSVSLRVKEYHLRTVVVLGEVKRPGTYEFPPTGRLTLMKAIALAGGFTNIAAIDRVHLIRKHENTQEVLQINVKDIINGKREDIEIQPDDLITIPETFF